MAGIAVLCAASILGLTFMSLFFVRVCIECHHVKIRLLSKKHLWETSGASGQLVPLDDNRVQLFKQETKVTKAA